MERRDNYLIQREAAKKHFLTFDQNRILACWNLAHDDQSIYVTFFGKRYRICRATGDVLRETDGSQAGFSEVLSIFDLLCHASRRPAASPSFAPVNSLTGRPPAAGISTTGMYASYAQKFGRDTEAFRTACTQEGGIPVTAGDIGFQFSVFADLQLLLKFYEADEEFPPQLLLLWNENALEYAQYETIFYMQGYLLERISCCPHLRVI